MSEGLSSIIKVYNLYTEYNCITGSIIMEVLQIMRFETSNVLMRSFIDSIDRVGYVPCTCIDLDTVPFV